MKKFLTGLLLIIGFVSSAQDSKLPVFITDSLDRYIKTGMKDWQVPGMSIAIVKDGKVVFMKGYGVRETGKNDPVDENTLFMIGSNTKAFTATTLAMLEQEKKLSLNDKVVKWMPEFKLRDPLATQEIMITDLLCHRLGFETFQGDFTYWTSKLNRSEIIGKMALVKAPYGFRTRWGYCNAAFVTAGQIIPKVTGKNWEDVVKEKILVPLKMDRTLMLSKEMITATNAASSHTIYKGKLIKLPYPMIDNLAPAGSISSSVKDMTNWLLTQLNAGKFEGNQVIPEAVLQTTYAPRSIMGMDPTDKAQTHFYLYGLGFVINDRAGKLIISHTGGVDGFVSSVMIVPEEKLGIVILTNTDQNNLFQNLTEEIRDAFLGLPYQGYSKQSLQYSRNNERKTMHWLDSLNTLVAKKNKPSTELKNFAGAFTNELYGDIQVKNENQALNIYFSNHPTLIGKLEHLKDNIFLCTYSNPTMGMKEIPFKIENGKVTGLTLRVADFVEFTPYEFVRKN